MTKQELERKAREIRNQQYEASQKKNAALFGALEKELQAIYKQIDES